MGPEAAGAHQRLLVAAAHLLRHLRPVHLQQVEELRHAAEAQEVREGGEVRAETPRPGRMEPLRWLHVGHEGRQASWGHLRPHEVVLAVAVEPSEDEEGQEALAGQQERHASGMESLESLQKRHVDKRHMLYIS